MANRQLTAVFNRLRQTAVRDDGSLATDGDLLGGFIARQDPAAFEAILRRHGPMVLGVCRRVLRNSADAEDAFQATFLVLVRNASSVRPRGMLGNWLYGVARNTAMNVRAMNLRRRQKEREAGMMSDQAAPEEVWGEVQALLDQELPALPEKYRAPIVLCDLESKTIREAARQLGWPQGTVATRLARARELLAERLTRRGVCLSGGALALALAHGAASGGVPRSLVDSTVQAAKAVAAGQSATAGVIPARAAVLAEAMARAVRMTRLKAATAVLLGGILLGGGLLTYAAFSARDQGQPRAVQQGAAADEGAVQPGRLSAEARRPHDTWLAAGRGIRRDPTLLIHYTFEPEQVGTRTLRNQAGDRTPSHDAAVARRPNDSDRLDGAIVGCEWAEGRRPGKHALEFKRVGDRVRLHVPGEFESVTLVAWVRVDALPNVNHSLFLTDGWQAGALHWQIGAKEPIGEARKLVLAVKIPPNRVKLPTGVESQSSSWSRSSSASADRDGAFPEQPENKSSSWSSLSATSKQPSIVEKILGKPAQPTKRPPQQPKRPDDPLKAEEGHYHAFNAFGPERLGKWVQLAVVYDRERGQVTHYVDGRPAAPVPIRVNVPLCIGNVEIGNWRPASYQSPDSVRNFVGCIDEFLLFTRALDDQEIAQLFADGRSPP